MQIFSFGEYSNESKFKVLDERVVRGSAGVMLLLAFIAFVNGFVLSKFNVIPYISGFLAINFLIGIFINPKFAPTMFISWLLIKKQSALPIGAIQKKFAWSLGLGLSFTIFVLSLFLLQDVSYFDPVCLLCLICIVLLYLESAFGICVGCKLYHTSIKFGLIKVPVEKPNCMGDSCKTDTRFNND